MRSKIANILLAAWLILTGLIVLTDLTIPSSETLLAVLAIVAGILIVLDIREAPTQNIGRLLLSIYLIILGLIPLLSLSFPSSDIVLAVLATVAGVLLLLGR